MPKFKFAYEEGLAAGIPCFFISDDDGGDKFSNECDTVALYAKFVAAFNPKGDDLDLLPIQEYCENCWQTRESWWNDEFSASPKKMAKQAAQILSYLRSDPDFREVKP